MADEHMKHRFQAFEILRAVDPDTGEARKLRVEDDGFDFFGLRVALYNWTGTQWAKATPAGQGTIYLTHKVEFDVNGKPTYEGWHQTFQADPTDTNWQLKKYYGWGTAEMTDEGPVAGRWDLKENYF